MKASIYLVIIIGILFTQCTSSKLSNNKDVENANIEYHSTLPNPLKSGDKIISESEWETHRDYLKKLLAYYQYGEMPEHRNFDKLDVEEIYSKFVFDSTAVEKKLLFTISNNNQTVSFRMGLMIPNKEGAFPIIIKNDTFLFSLDDIKDEDKVAYYRQRKRDTIATFASRKAIQKGYILCKFIRNDIAEDHNDNRDSGIFPLYPEYSWGTIAAWAWGYSIIIDWLADQPYVNTNQIVATGHSRGGKTALCAGIYDERIAITVPNSSGTGGTGSWRYFDTKHKPQTLKVHEERYAYWWSQNLFEFSNSIERMPFDAHFNKMLIAPRALLNTHSRDDYWANPYGTYLTHLAAQPIFDAYKKPKHLAVHWRDGRHNQDFVDWEVLFDYSDWIFFQKPLSMEYNQNPHPDYKYESILDPYFKFFEDFGEIEIHQK